MYSEIIPANYEMGLHNGTLVALEPLSAHGLQIAGLDPGNRDNWNHLQRTYGSPDAQIPITVDHPDEQTARDIATIARHSIWRGGPLWGIDELNQVRIPPIDRLNQGANYLRRDEGLPQEGPMQIAASVAVRGDMSVTSKWTVVALGELQQPGGVGATNEYNPVVDGPNPDGPDYGDNAGNSPEQEVALQTWVNMAIDLLNRGETPEAILAQLAHDGCPDPQTVLKRAQQQPEHSPISDSIGQDPFEVPTTPDPETSGQMQGLSQQPPTLAKVRIAGTTMTGVAGEEYEDMWGQKLVRVALDEGGSMTVAPSALESAQNEKKHPVSEIQEFIDSMPEVQPSRPYIEARLANLELVRRAVRANISKVGFSDQVKLEKMDSDAAAEAAFLKEVLADVTEDFQEAYVKNARRFEYDAFGIGDAPVVEWSGNAREAGAIWATENFDSPIDDNESFVAAAAHFASNVGLTGTQFKEFLSGAEEHRIVRTEEFAANEPETDNDGPAEALFL